MHLQNLYQFYNAENLIEINKCRNKSKDINLKRWLNIIFLPGRRERIYVLPLITRRWISLFESYIRARYPLGLRTDLPNMPTDNFSIEPKRIQPRHSGITELAR